MLLEFHDSATIHLFLRGTKDIKRVIHIANYLWVSMRICSPNLIFQLKLSNGLTCANQSFQRGTILFDIATRLSTAHAKFRIHNHIGYVQ